MKEIEKLTNDYLSTEQGLKELEDILSEVEIDSDSLVKIENKVLKKINVKHNKPAKLKRNMMLVLSAAILMISTVSFQKDSFHAWASEYLSYLPMINTSIDNKSESPLYEFDSFIGEHKNIKINNLAFNSELPYFQIEYEYDLHKKISDNEYDEFYKYWNSLDIYLKVNNKKYELVRDYYGIGEAGIASDQLRLKETIKRIEKPTNNKIQFVIGNNTFSIKLKEVDHVFYQSKSNLNKNIELKTMFRKENDHLLINYLTEGEITPYSFKPSRAYLTDSKGKKVFLTSNENSSTVRFKFKAKTNHLDSKTLTLVTPSILRMETFKNLTWDIPIPTSENEEILLPDLIIPNSNLKVSGAKVKKEFYESNSLEIIMPKQNKNENQWLLQLDMNLVENQGNSNFVSAISSGTSNGHFEPDGYIIDLNDTNQKSIKLNISSVSIIENGPWKTDLSNIK